MIEHQNDFQNVSNYFASNQDSPIQIYQPRENQKQKGCKKQYSDSNFLAGSHIEIKKNAMNNNQIQIC